MATRSKPCGSTLRGTCAARRDCPSKARSGVEKCATIAKEQAIDRNTALRMATINSAYYMLKENELGSLEAGKWADFIVLDRDFFTVPEQEIGKLKVLLTAIGGKVVFADPVFEAVDKDLFKGPEYQNLKRESTVGLGGGGGGD